MQNVFVDNAKVMAKGQVTIPKDIRKVLGIAEGDRVSFVVEGDSVRLVNTAIYAMKMLQSEMSDIRNVSENDVIDMVKEIRSEGTDDESID